MKTQLPSLPKKLIIMMCGLPGAGKTTTAHRIRLAMTDAIVISRNYFRNPYKGNGFLDEYAKVPATIIDRIFYARVKEFLPVYSTIILDATFREFIKRQAAIDFAQKHGRELFIIECICSYPILLQRLTSQMLSKQKKFVKPPNELLDYYIKDVEAAENEMNRANFIQLDTEKNLITLKFFQDHQSCQFTTKLVGILERPFDPSSVEPCCATYFQEELAMQEISQFGILQLNAQKKCVS